MLCNSYDSYIFYLIKQWTYSNIFNNTEFNFNMLPFKTVNIKKNKAKWYGGGLQLLLKRLPDSSISSLIRAGWHQEGYPPYPVTKNSNIPIDRQLPFDDVAEGWLSTLCCWEAAIHTLTNLRLKWTLKSWWCLTIKGLDHCSRHNSLRGLGVLCMNQLESQNWQIITKKMILDKFECFNYSWVCKSSIRNKSFVFILHE